MKDVVKIRNKVKNSFGVFLLFLCILCGCQGKQQGEEPLISVTIEPQRYFVEWIGGERFKVNCVVPSGQSPETYDPTPQEMVRLGKSVAYFQVGHIGFELAWMKKIQENNPQLKLFDLSEGMNIIKDEKEEEGHDHEFEGGHDHKQDSSAEEGEPSFHHHHPGGIDPHIWSSIQGGKVIALNTLNALIALEPDQEAYFKANYERVLSEIEETEKTIRTLLEPLRGQAFIIYHPSLTYFAMENGLVQLCIEMDGKEPSPGQLEELVRTAKEAHARVVFIQKEFDRKNAELIAKEVGCRLVQINPLAYDWKAEMIHIAKTLAENGKAD